MKSLDLIEPRTAIYELPFAITNSGSYYLADSLDGVAARNGITIAADDVRLDLNGFSIWGTNGALHGIFVTAASHNISIRNGVVGEWSLWGLYANGAFKVEVSKVKFYQNGNGGMKLGFGAEVDRCNVQDNGGPGIVTAHAATVTGCKAGDNGADGIRVLSGSAVEGCIVAGNGGDGIAVTDFCTVSKCLSLTNDTNGISCTWSCIIRDNNCGENGRPNRSGAGIHVKDGANRIQGNNVNDNHIGVLLDRGGNRVSDNSMMSNGFGLQDKGNGNLIHGNNVGWSESGTNFIFSGRANVGEIQRSPGPGLGNANAWANFEIQ